MGGFGAVLVGLASPLQYLILAHMQEVWDEMNWALPELVKHLPEEAWQLFLQVGGRAG